MTDYKTLYANTIIEIMPGDAPVIVVDLRRALDARTVAVLREMFGDGFALVTAQDPHGRLASEQANERRAMALEGQLDSLRIPFLRADGRSPDGKHRERGVAVAITSRQARSLAREHEQVAFYWFDGSTFWLEGALLDMPRRRLPADDGRLSN